MLRKRTLHSHSRTVRRVYKIEIRFLDLVDRDRYRTSENERNMSSVLWNALHTENICRRSS